LFREADHDKSKHGGNRTLWTRCETGPWLQWQYSTFSITLQVRSLFSSETRSHYYITLWSRVQAGLDRKTTGELKHSAALQPEKEILCSPDRSSLLTMRQPRNFRVYFRTQYVQKRRDNWSVQRISKTVVCGSCYGISLQETLHSRPLPKKFVIADSIYI
jgi:hypothetical protein